MFLHKVTIFVVSNKASVDTRYFFNKHDKFSYGNNVLFIPIYIVKMTALLRLPKEVGDLFMSFAFLLVLLVKLNCVVGNLCSGYGQAQRCGGLILVFFFLVLASGFNFIVTKTYLCMYYCLYYITYSFNRNNGNIRITVSIDRIFI